MFLWIGFIICSCNELFQLFYFHTIMFHCFHCCYLHHFHKILTFWIKLITLFPVHYLSLLLSFSYSIVLIIFIIWDVNQISKTNNENNENNENNAGIFEWHLSPHCYMPLILLISLQISWPSHRPRVDKSHSTTIAWTRLAVARCAREACAQTVRNSPGIAYRGNTKFPNDSDISDWDDVENRLPVVELV